MPDQSPITRPPLPDRIARLARARVGHLVGLEPRGPQRLPGAGLRAVAELGAQPGAAAAAGAGGAPGAGGARPDLPEPLRPGDQGARSRPQRRGQLVDAAQRPRPDPRHRLLLGRVRRCTESLPIYAGGLGVLAGDHCKSASDLGLPLRRHRLHLPQGYFRQQRLVRRLAGRALPATWTWTTLPIEPALTRRRQAAASSPCRSASAPCCVRSGTSRWGASPSTCSTPISRRTRRGPRALRAPLRRRPRDAHPAGDRPGHRRRPRAARARHRARRSGT